ncbi:Fibronectin type-III domain-containing protein [Entamoeba marina]
MQDKLLFENKISVYHELFGDNKYKVKVTWNEPTSLPHSNFMIGLYCYKRQMDKNYCYYEFPIVVPKGYYDIRICSWNVGITGNNYKRLYQIKKYYVNDIPNELQVEIEWKKEKQFLLVKLNKPAEEGDYIGLFEHSTLIDVLERYFDVNIQELGDTIGKHYEVRYFRNDCVITNLTDYSTIPFAISNVIDIRK